MTKIREIRQQDPRENIPEMLRALADKIEKGVETYSTVWVIGLDDLEEVPMTYLYGRMVPRIIEIGAITAVLSSFNAMDCID